MNFLERFIVFDAILNNSAILIFSAGQHCGIFSLWSILQEKILTLLLAQRLRKHYYFAISDQTKLCEALMPSI